ncbi:MAG: translesion error-prone DNA polymerase V autoproteolytic subunit [Bacteroidales bacterium]|nr:translesion error-prone DNA polymerase V autoproteolytic subunit [Bacteroidales bacterium]
MDEYSRLSAFSDDADERSSYNPNAIHAGFPSPAQNYMNGTIDLNRVLVRHRETTFFARVDGDTMKDAGIGNGDIVVIDKSLDPKDGDIVVAYLDGEFVLRRLQVDKKQKCAWLLSADSKSKPTKITPENNFVIWGVVTYTIKKIR